MLPRLCFASALCCLGSISGGSVLSRLFVVLALYCTGSSLPPAPHCPGSVLPRHVLPWLSVAPALQKKKKKKNYRDSVLSRLCVTFFLFCFDLTYAASVLRWFGSTLLRLYATSDLVFTVAVCCPSSLLSRLFVAQALHCPGSMLPRLYVALAMFLP